MNRIETSGIEVVDRSTVELKRDIFQKTIPLIELFDDLYILSAASDYSTENRQKVLVQSDII